MHQENNRRPLKSRGSAWSLWLVNSLRSHRFTPNQISLASIGFACAAGFSFILLGLFPGFGARAPLFVLAALGIQLRLLCNLLDGMLAIEGGIQSKTGEIYNELPDRISDLIILFCAGFSISPESGLILSGTALGCSAAILALLTAYIRLLGVSVGSPHYYCGPMAKQHRMAILTITCLLCAFIDTPFPLMALTLWLILLGSMYTCIRRVRFICKFLDA